MRLQEVLELTKLSRKAIYFYIKEELINPTKNLENGYYDFSKDDLKKLQIISSLRKTGMSIQDIKNIFEYPRLTNFFIHQQVNNLKKSIYEQLNQLQVSYNLIENIPANATPNNIEVSVENLDKHYFKHNSFIETQFPNIDSRMIAILILAPFTDIQSSEYHNFLLDKISSELKYQLENKLIYFKKLIYTLTPEQIEKTSLEKYMICKSIAEAEESELVKYEIDLYENYIELSKNIELQNYWKIVYEPILIPILSFLSSKVISLLNEFNPQYIKYSKNMKQIVSNVNKKILEDRKVLESLRKNLDYKFNSERFDYVELGCLYTFNKDIYTQIKLSDLKRLIEE